MSRNIDWTAPLSDDDIAYIRDRPWLVDEAGVQGVSLEASPEDDSLGEVYSKMKGDELKAELVKRQLPVSGAKQELIDRLLADDADTSDDDEEEELDDEEESEEDDSAESEGK